MLELKVKVYKGTTKEGKKFDYYKAVKADGKLIDVKFRREVKDLPVEDSVIVVQKLDINLDSNRLYPCLWVKDIVEIKEIARVDQVDDEAIKLFE